MNITLITNFGEPWPDYETIYADIVLKAAEKLKENPENKKECHKKLVFAGVKHAVHSMDHFWESAESASCRLNVLCLTRGILSLMTPAELIQLFPVKKTYNGERYGVKDFFYTMNVLNAHGMDTPMGNAVMDILWDYVNPTIRMFVLANTRVVNDLYRIQRETNLSQEDLHNNGYTH